MGGFDALREQVVLVTGAASGLGAVLCEQLVERGARVAALDLNTERVGALVERLQAAGASHANGLAADDQGNVRAKADTGDGGRDTQAKADTGDGDGDAQAKTDIGGGDGDVQAKAYTVDVGDVDDVARVLAAVADDFGRLDVIVNGAAIDITASLHDVDVAGWERVLRTNLLGPFLLSKLGLEYLNARGHIVNIVSTAARRAWPNASAYHASKWGLMGLSQALHAELRASGIKVSAVIAGGMRTPFLLDRFPDIDVSTLQDPAHVARAVLFALTQPAESVIPEIMVLPMKETSWP